MKVHKLPLAEGGDIFLITRSHQPFLLIEGERVVILQASVVEDVAHYLRNHSIAHVMHELGVSDRVVMSLRKHFGIRGDVENKGEPK